MNRTKPIGTAFLVGLLLLVPTVSRAQDLREEIEAIVKDYLASHPDEVGRIVQGYFVQHPDAFGQILAESLKRRSAVTASTGGSAAANISPDQQRAAVASNERLLFSSEHQVTLGNAQGDVSLVEFFDYNCGYCKRALPDMLTLLKDDPKLKVVLKEFPITGAGLGRGGTRRHRGAHAGSDRAKVSCVPQRASR